MAPKLSLRKLRRIPEVLACGRASPQWLALTAGYLRCPDLKYPFILRTRSGTEVELADYSELTTAWHVLFGGEYRLSTKHRRIVDLGANIGEVDVGLGDLKLAEEKFAHALVIVLARVHEQRLYFGRPGELLHHRRDLHEVRPRADDIDDSDAHMSIPPDLPKGQV